MVKLEIQSGSSSIKIEGELDEVERILSGYWRPTAPSDQSESGGAVASNDTAPLGNSKIAGRRKGKRPPSKSLAGDMGAPKADALDAENVANNIKTHPLFGQFKSKVLDVKGEWISKCKMVALVASVPITSGDVARVLTILRIRAPLPRVSEALSAHSTDFITRGVSPVAYTMTSVAEDAFKAWVAASPKQAA